MGPMGGIREEKRDGRGMDEMDMVDGVDEQGQTRTGREQF
jgi:hypothetical protein